MGVFDELAGSAWQGRGMEPPWFERLAKTDKGAPRPVLHNVMTVLAEHEAWQDLFVYDEFSNKIYKTRSMPCHGESGEFNETDGTEIAAWLGDPENVGLHVNSKMVLECVESLAKRRTVHPVREYLDGLTWDGTTRLETLFSDFYGAEQSDYTAAVGVNIMLAAVARVMWSRDHRAGILAGDVSHGAQVDFMVVLEGSQGIRKTTSIEALFHPKWFAETMESPAHKDFYQNLSGRWAMEISEMNAFSKADVNKIKQAITTKVDVYRPSYGRYTAPFPRQCVFFGTTNEDTYLRDPSGARRFLPIRVTDVNLEALVATRDQLWAEALARYKRGEPWWHFPASAAEEQDRRYQGDSWEEPVVAWLNGEAPDAFYDQMTPLRVNEVTTTQIMQQALQIEVAKHTRQDQMRVGAIMRHMGWDKRQVRHGAHRGWVYVRPDHDRESF